MRVAWYRVLQTNVSPRQLASRLRAAPFSDAKGTGFLITRSRQTELEARHIEKLEGATTFEDPLGRQITRNVLEYRTSDFVYRTAGPELEVRNPARSLKLLLSQLGQRLDFPVITPCEMAPVVWADKLSKHAHASRIVGVEVREIDVGRQVTATLTARGPGDVLKRLRAMSGVRGGTVHRVDLALRLDRSADEIWCRLETGGRARVRSEDPSGSLLDLLRGTLEMA